jgi:hypothetical protein
MTRPISPAKALYKEYLRREVGGVKLLLKDFDVPLRIVELADIRAELTGRGLGTLAIGELVKCADKLGIGLILVPRGSSGKGWYDKLVGLYKRFKFKMDGAFMFRPWGIK